MIKYIVAQLVIFFSVFFTLRFFDINYNGVSWEYSLAYGSLIPLALFYNRRDIKTLICLGCVAALWFLGRVVELSHDPHSMVEWLRGCFILGLVCVICERYRLAAIALLMFVYSARLSVIEASYWQQGLLNLISVSPLFMPPPKTEEDNASSAAGIEEDRQEAA